MTTKRDVDRIAAAFLAEGPETLPDRVIDAVIDEVHLTRQRRVIGASWRLPDMTLPIRVATAAAIVVLVIAGALLLLGRPGPGVVGGVPSATSTPSVGPSAASTQSGSPSASSIPELGATFVSPRHGYTIRHPSDWTATPATKPWTSGIDTTYRDPSLDAISSNEALLAVGSAPLAKGQTAEQWLAPYCRSGADHKTCGRQIAIGDKVGYVDEDGLSAEGGTVASGGVIFDAAVVADGRGYIFILDGHVDRRLFEALLSTVQFDAGSAVDTP